MKQSKRTVIFDVDTGSDDAAALICAVLSNQFDILGITSVWGAVPVKETTLHTLMVTELLRIELPIYQGCAQSMARGVYLPEIPVGVPGNQAVEPSGKTVGFHDVFYLPTPVQKACDTHAVTFLVESLRKTNMPVTVVATGALTNLGCALRLAPDIAASIDELVIMGGGVAISNKTMAAEGNFWRDPEAARIVLECGAKITLVPLDTTHEAATHLEEYEAIKTIGTDVSDFFAHIVHCRIQAYNQLQPLGEDNIAIMHDLVCVMLLLDHSLIREYRPACATISLDRGETSGQLVVDQRHIHGKENITLALGINATYFNEQIINLLKKTRPK
jgi:inosine-uridine nucleoside N-ribohydrolase